MENVLFTRQRHEADKAGLHYDYRLVIGDKAHSWATKKELPEVGKSIMLWEQPVHTADYALSKKVVIPKGQYGAGVTTLDWVKKGKAQFEDGKIVIHTKDGRFLLKKMPDYQDGTGWLFKQLPKEEKMNNKYLEKIAGLGSTILYHKASKGLLSDNPLTSLKSYFNVMKLNNASTSEKRKLIENALRHTDRLSDNAKKNLVLKLKSRTSTNRGENIFTNARSLLK